MLGQRFPVPCDEDSGEAVPVSMQFMEVHGGEDGCPKEVVTPLEAQMPAGFWPGLWRPYWSRFAGRTCDPVRDPRCSSSRTVTCRKDSHWRSLWRTVSCERNSTLEQCEKTSP